MRESTDRFAKFEIHFMLNDPRLDKITATAFRIYVNLWTYAVGERDDRLTFPARSAHASASIARLCRVDPRTVRQGLANLQQECLINVTETQDETVVFVCGVRDKHSKLKWKEVTRKPTKGRKAPDKIKNRIDKEKNRGDDIPYVEIISHLNLVSGRNFKLDGLATKELIRGRWAEGFRVTDFKWVHIVKSIDPFFQENRKYLQPKTLYARSNFDGYRNEDPNPGATDKNDNYIYNEKSRYFLKVNLDKLKQEIKEAADGDKEDG